MSAKIDLPIDAHMPGLLALSSECSMVLLAASPGSGKTTRFPPALVKTLANTSKSTPQQVIVLEPRRIAAVTAAHRIAGEEGWTLGREVGYQIRFENKSSAETQLLFLTEALLQKNLQQDPTLSQVAAVILDEFHERSVHTETALCLLRELQESFRPDLKIIIMSATLQMPSLQRALPEAKVFEVIAPPHPLEIRVDNKTQLPRPGPEFYERCLQKIREAWRESPGQKDILVFLPGVREINEMHKRLSEQIDTEQTRVLPLHAQLPVNEQLRALNPEKGKRRILLATNVAESALTIDGVDTVVDSGLERLSQIHHRTGFPSLDLVRITQASATQRAGRAARQGPGLCLQMWSSFDPLVPERLPEIHRIELTELSLNLAGLGITRPESLPWLDPPSVTRWENARKFLRSLDLVDSGGRLTAEGERALRYPLHPRWAKLLLRAEDLGVPALGAQIAALLQNWGQSRLKFSELHQGLIDYQSRPDLPHYHWVRKTEDQLRSLLGKSWRPSRPADSEALDEILWASFPDRLARKREGQERMAVMIGPRGLRLPEGHWKDLDCFLALELIDGLGNETQCSLVYSLRDRFVQDQILPMAEKVSRVEWVEKEERFIKESGASWGGVWLEKPHRVPARPDEVGDALVNMGLERWADLMSRNEELREANQRYAFYRRRQGFQGTELISEEQKREFLHWATQGESSYKALLEKNLVELFESTLLVDNLTAYRRACPASITTPKGRQAKVSYSENQAPHIEVRIQDAFGWSETPQIMNQALVIDLLAPNGRPAQRTQDLNGFWKSSYLDVRKELRARYPKHHWPEDPMTHPHPDPVNKKRS